MKKGLYILILPELQAFFTLMLPLAVLMFFFVKLPVWMAILTFMLFYCFLFAMFIDLAGLHEFVKVHHRKWKWSEAFTHREHLSLVLNNVGVITTHRGELTQASAYFQEGLALARQIGLRAQVCLLLSNLGEMAVKPSAR